MPSQLFDGLPNSGKRLLEGGESLRVKTSSQLTQATQLDGRLGRLRRCLGPRRKVEESLDARAQRFGHLAGCLYFDASFVILLLPTLDRHLVDAARSSEPAHAYLLSVHRRGKTRRQLRSRHD